MLAFGLNHMTTSKTCALTTLEVAAKVGCVGVELRNDLAEPMFAGLSPDEFGQEAQTQGQRILALAEVYGFNDPKADIDAKVMDLKDRALRVGAEAIVFIPRIADGPTDRDTQRTLLRAALVQLRPHFEGTGIKALIEPLGFAHSTLRYKSVVLDVLDDLGAPDCFGIIHDTFHHTLTGDDNLCAELTDIVHISGVAAPAKPMTDFCDADRDLVTEGDRLGTLDQIVQLSGQGYEGVLSFEAFAPQVHALTDPIAALLKSIAFITSKMSDHGIRRSELTAFA